MGRGLLVAAFDFSTAHADEFHDWYDLEHIPERQRVPGFINAERWIGTKRPTLSIATYDLDNVAVLASAPYLAVAGLISAADPEPERGDYAFPRWVQPISSYGRRCESSPFDCVRYG